MSTKRRTFTEAFKMQVLSDYYSNVWWWVYMICCMLQKNIAKVLNG